jgi:hypothetical protein
MGGRLTEEAPHMSTPRNQIDYSTRGAVADVTAAFAGVMLIVTACFDVLQGGAAIGNPDFFAGDNDYFYELNVTAWGWIHVVVGVLTIAVGVAVLRGVTWGRIIGIMLAALNALTNFLFIPVYPWWAMTIIAINVLVIWALTMQLKSERA